MEVNDAIKIAKDYIRQIYRDEGVFNVGLEEVEFDNDIWEVTIGFSRKWDRPTNSVIQNAVGRIDGPDYRATNRTYKIVEIDDSTGTVKAVTNRQVLS